MDLSIKASKNWRILGQGGLIALGGFAIGATLDNKESTAWAGWLHIMEKFNQSDGPTFFSWLPTWLFNALITLLIVWIGLWLVRYIAKRMIQPKLVPEIKSLAHHLNPRTVPLRPERRQTLRSLVTNPINLMALTVAGVVGLAHFIGWTNVTLLTGALSLASASLIRDLQGGFQIIFEDTFNLGEKVQIGSIATRIEGIVESINMRTTAIRASGGELYVVPHGEIRVVRNFSRGEFATTSLKLKIAAVDLKRTLLCFNELGQEAVTLLPNLLEPWQVTNASGSIGQHAELTLLARVGFGQQDQMRLDLMALIQERLAEAGVSLVD